MISRILIFASIFVFISCKKSFDSERWKDKPEDRIEMLDDLVKSEILIGKSKLEVIKLIDTTGTKKPFDVNNDYWMYIIAKKHSLVIHSPVEVLDIEFKNGKVISAEKRK